VWGVGGEPRNGERRGAEAVEGVEGNRYVDRFVVQDGQIVKMDVWNDSAERILVQRGIEA